MQWLRSRWTCHPYRREWEVAVVHTSDVLPHNPFGSTNNHFHCHSEGEWGDGTSSHYTHFQRLPCCIFWCFDTELKISEVVFHHVSNGTLDVKKLKAVQIREKQILKHWLGPGIRGAGLFLTFWQIGFDAISCSHAQSNHEKPGIPAFCTEVSIKVFSFRYVVILFAIMLKKTFPSKFSRLICWN